MAKTDIAEINIQDIELIQRKIRDYQQNLDSLMRLQHQKFLKKIDMYEEARRQGPLAASTSPVDDDLVKELFGDVVKIVEQETNYGIEGTITTPGYKGTYHIITKPGLRC